MGNQHLKGIVIEIGGDTSELAAELKKMDQAAKKSADELKSINAALKLDPTNTVLLAQKQDVLAQSIDGTKKKLDLLKKAEQDAQKQLKEGKIGQDQYRALQREVVYAEGKLKKLEQQYDDTAKAAKDSSEAVEQSGKASQKAAGQNKELQKELQKLRKDYDDAKDAAKGAGAELGAVAAAGAAAAGATVALAMSYDDALDSIRIQTGAGAEDMVGFETAMKAVFDSGLGESIDDVASSMAAIAQQTHLTDPDQLQKLTQNALVLKDGFGFETAEQLRAVNMLMTQFGLSSEEAYELIAQGAQKGLNKNGDLLDVINEYSVHYKALGYDAEDFFNSLHNGAATGVFSVDKLGDAMKEFGIRTKDEAAGTTEAYEKLGLNADEMRKNFAAGGDSAQAAAKLVNDALFAMDDSVAQNAVGVALYGTMWEDLGKDAVFAMANATGEISATGKAMERVRDIKLESTSTKWAALGRTVQTELLMPIGEKLLPVVKEGIDFCIEHSQTLIPIVKALGAVIATVFVVNKVANFTKSIKELKGAFSALKSSASGAGGSVGALGSAFRIASAATLAYKLTIGPMIAEHERASKAFREEQQKLRELTGEYVAAADVAEESAKRQQDAVNNVNYDYKKYDDLLEELEKLVDANGKVIEGNEERVAYISDELSGACGYEIEIVDGVVQKYGQLRQSIEDAMTARKTYDLLGEMEGDYKTARSALDGGVDVIGSQAAYEAAADKYYALMAIANDRSMSWSEKNEAMKKYGMTEKLWTEGGGRDSTLLAMQQAQAAYDFNRATVSRYMGLESAYYSQNPAQMRAAMDAVGNATYAAGEYSYATLRQLQLEAAENYRNLVQWSQREGNSVTKSQIADAQAELEYTTNQALLQWIAEGRPIYMTEEQADPLTDSPGTVIDMKAAAEEAYSLLGKDLGQALESLLIGYFSDPNAAMAAFERGTDYMPGYAPELFRSVAPSHGGHGGQVGGIGNLRTTMLYAPFKMDPMLWKSYAAANAGGVSAAVSKGDEKMQRNNDILGKILDRIENLELSLNIDGETVARKTLNHTNKNLGRLSREERRGNLLE